MANEEDNAAMKKELARDAAEAKKNPTMCVYNTADGRCATVPYTEGEKMLKGKDWVDSPAKVKAPKDAA